MGASQEEDALLDLTSKVYKVVVEHGAQGVLQSLLWKELSLSSRDGSRLSIRLEHRGMIRREKVLDDGRWTYKLTPLRMPVAIECIEQAPCITCPYEPKCSITGAVSPLSCPWICEWVLKEFKEMAGTTNPQSEAEERESDSEVTASRKHLVSRVTARAR